MLALGYDPARLPEVIKAHCNARDLMQGGEHCHVIDFFGYTAEEARAQHPALYQWLFDRVKPERDHNNDAQRRRDWWLFGRSNSALRLAWADVPRLVLTPETAKHRVFVFQSRPFCPDHKLYAVCIADALALGVLSSRVHVPWALAGGGTLEDRPTWTNTTVFLTFPFPDPTPERAERIRSLAEAIDAHRKRQQAAHPGLTLTGLYNVIEKLRSGEALTAKERIVHEQGLASVLKELHDELDAAVFAAYGWSDLAPRLVGRPGATTPLPDKPADQAEAEEELLTRLVTLNAERAAEEARGLVRWLRPEFQKPAAIRAPEQTELDTETEETAVEIVAVAAQKRAWPPALPDQVRTVAQVLAEVKQPLTMDELAARFTGRGPWKKRLPQVLATLEAVGRLRKTDAGAYSTT